LAIPDSSGLGVEIDRDKLRKFVPDPSPLFP
jgi:D-galactarolactone cycloisomerase